MSFSQKIIYECICKYYKEKGISPSVRDLCRMASLSSSATVHKHLKNLERLGYIYIEKNKPRGIIIIKGDDVNE